MGSYLLYHNSTADGMLTGQYVPENLAWSIRNSQPGEISYEIPMSEPFLTSPEGGNPEFGPYQTHYSLYRAGQGQNYKLLTQGMITSVNLNGDRDSILVQGKDWLHYLERRLYPFNPNSYVTGDWVNWPVGWPHEDGGSREIEGLPVDVVTIVQEIIARMRNATTPDIPGVSGETNLAWTLPITFNVPESGFVTKYSILPADTETIFGHIQTLSEQVSVGFEFDILPQSLAFKMYMGGRLGTQNVYSFGLARDHTDGEIFGAVTDLDWTNDGPAGTFIWGTGTSKHTAGAVWYYKPSLDKYLWMDQRYDYGEMRNTDVIFDLLKDQHDLFPQEKLGLTILNPEYMPLNFYGADRPRSLIGNRVGFAHNFSPYVYLNRSYKVNAINCEVDQSSNELVTLELEPIYE